LKRGGRTSKTLDSEQDGRMTWARGKKVDGSAQIKPQKEHLADQTGSVEPGAGCGKGI